MAKDVVVIIDTFAMDEEVSFLENKINLKFETQ